MATLDAYPEPLRVGVVEDEIVVTGPGGVGVALTPEAAAATAQRLDAAARQVRDPAGPYASQATANEA